MHVAFVGAGNMARTHLAALRRVKTPHTVVGVFDTSGAAAEEFARIAGPQATPYGTLEALLATTPLIVHICTPAGTHYEPARQALSAGAHVYVEKPFVETAAEADSLLELAAQHRLMVCAGHQLQFDPPFAQLTERAAGLQPITQVDSYFAFRPPMLALHRASDQALASQLLDILPHPLYTLLVAMSRVTARRSLPAIVSVRATTTDINALLSQGDVVGRLSVSLRARPVASTLAITGAGGTLTADFVRGMVIGAGNDGTSPIEKILNPIVEAGQLAGRTAASVVRRLTRGGYGGLVELFDSFYAAARSGSPSPIPPEELRAVAQMYQELAAAVHGSIPRQAGRRTAPRRSPDAPLAVLTGANGFLGREIARELARRRFRVRGIGRGSEPPPDMPAFDQWIRADLSRPLHSGILEGADVVIHAAAETAGGFAAHQRNTIDATKHVLDAMSGAEVRRLVLVSSLSVVAPPRTPWERQDEQTPRADQPERLGPYTWGKCIAEQLVAAAADAGQIESRVVRPGALFDNEHIELPGLLGRRLFGDWHLGLGRPGLPLPVCDVRLAAQVLAWCAADFEAAPPVINLFDPGLLTRRQLLASWRERGWHGKMVWAPISLLAGVLRVARLRQPQPIRPWSILRPRRFDPSVSRAAIAAARETVEPTRAQPAGQLAPVQL